MRDLGILEVSHQWASFTGRGRLSTGEERSVSVIVEQADPFAPDNSPTITIAIEGRDPISGVLTPGKITLTQTR